MRLLLKRTIDVLVSSLGLILFSPFMLLTALMVRLNMGSPVLFCQVRPGLHAKPFMLLKFRTMTDARDADGTSLPDARRLTALGRWLRSTSLDEVPQLWNILKGELSLVGPRPLLMQYLERYSRDQARRLEVKPGMTGWAQVNGRNAISWEEKFELDVWYVDHWSLWLDFRILSMTLWQALRREGISGEGHATMPEFLGNGNSSLNHRETSISAP
jgi:sugar transferase EpsL